MFYLNNISFSAPAIFPVLFNFVKPFLNHSTMEKIQIFDSNKDKWFPALLDEIEINQIPSVCRGTMENEDYANPIFSKKV